MGQIVRTLLAIVDEWGTQRQSWRVDDMNHAGGVYPAVKHARARCPHYRAELAWYDS
jgi:hypothetical protein